MPMFQAVSILDDDLLDKYLDTSSIDDATKDIKGEIWAKMSNYPALHRLDFSFKS